jgi:16S rRNA (guanine966-N2)-methyltransferase
MRVIGGKFKGRSLRAPSSTAIRPTSDRLRETLFNILAHGSGNGVEGARVLDLFAGTGALGIEALSRGASFCLFLDKSAQARGLIRQNIEALGLNGITKLFKRDATHLGKIGTLLPFDLVFCDPPYGKGLAEAALVSAQGGGWLKQGALIAVEEEKGALLDLPFVFQLQDKRMSGDSALHLYKFSGG